MVPPSTVKRQLSVLEIRLSFAPGSCPGGGSSSRHTGVNCFSGEGTQCRLFHEVRCYRIGLPRGHVVGVMRPPHQTDISTIGTTTHRSDRCHACRSSRFLQPNRTASLTHCRRITSGSPPLIRGLERCARGLRRRRKFSFLPAARGKKMGYSMGYSTVTHRSGGPSLSCTGTICARHSLGGPGKSAQYLHFYRRHRPQDSSGARHA